MKHLLAFLSTLMLLLGTSIAESSLDRSLTVEEQAFDAYLDISTAYNAGVDYLKEVKYLWEEAVSLDSLSEADQLWFNAKIILGNEPTDTKRFTHYYHLAKTKYGYEDCLYLYDHFAAALSSSTGTLGIVGPALSLAIEAGYVLSPEAIDEYIDQAKVGIKNIMSHDPNYAFTGQSQNYYKELSLLQNYIYDFDDSYFEFSDRIEKFVEKQISFDVDFEFIFDPSDYNYVYQIRSAKQQEKYFALYSQALTLENNREYEKAIEFYWQCRNYEDSNSRIKACREYTLEPIYQEAYAFELSGAYDEAIELYQTISGYKDSNIRIVHCENHQGFEKVMSFSEGLAAAKKDGKWGYIDTMGNVVIPFQYNSVQAFSEGLAWVRLENSSGSTYQYGAVNTQGNLVIPFTEYELTEPFSNGLSLVCKNDKFGYVDKTGKIAIECQYFRAQSFSEGFAVVTNEEWISGYIDTNGTLVIPYCYNTANSFSSGLAFVDSGYINTNGEYAIEHKYYYSSVFSEGLAMVCNREGNSLILKGYIDRTGNRVIDCTFDYGTIFTEGYAAVKKGEKWGCINKNGDLIIPINYEEIGYEGRTFSNGIAIVSLDGKRGIIDMNGNALLPCEYDYITECQEGYFITMKNNDISIYDNNIKKVF